MEEFFFEDEEGLAEAQKTREMLVDTQHRMGEILELMPVGLIIHEDQTIVFANKETARLLDETQEALVGRHLFDFVHGDSDGGQFAEFQTLFGEQEIVRLQEVSIRASSGAEFIVRVTAGRLPWEGVPVAQVLLQDITELKQKERMLYLSAITDPLTRSYNRGHFIEISEELIDETRRDGEPLSLALLDVDHFKQVNDTMGHATGDAVLKDMVSLCNGALKEEYPELAAGRLGVARVGGEEFALVLPRLDGARAVAFADDLRKRIAASVTTHKTNSLSVTTSIGVATLTTADDVDSLLAHADAALYQAKESGRDRVIRYRPSLTLAPEDHRVARTDRTAIAQGAE